MQYKTQYKIIAILLLASILLSGYTKYNIIIEDGRALEVSEQICKQEMGKRERTGRNDGKHITRYMNSTYLSGERGYPYCAAGQVYCLQIGCDSVNINYPFDKHSALANYHFDYAKAYGRKVAPIPDKHDYVVWKAKRGNTGHIERVKDTLSRFIVTTYAFNTSNGKKGSQREGNGNYIRTRHLKSPLGRLRLRGIVGFEEINNNNYKCIKNK